MGEVERFWFIVSGDSTPFAVVGEVTRLGSGGAKSRSLLAVRPIGGGGRGSLRERGVACLPLVEMEGEEDEEEMCWGTGGRVELEILGRAGGVWTLTVMLSMRDGVSSPRSAASTATASNT